MGVNSLPKGVTRQRNQGPSAPESSMLTTQLPSHPDGDARNHKINSN